MTAIDGLWQVQTAVLITVLDAEDEVPVFARQLFHFGVTRAQLLNYSTSSIIAGVPIGQVMATDADEDPHLVYSLSPSRLFSIDPVSGELFILDQLELDHHHLRVFVSDGTHIVHVCNFV